MPSKKAQPSLSLLLAYDALITAACACMFGVTIVPVLAAKRYGWAWHWELAAWAITSAALLALAETIQFLRKLEFVSLVREAYERAGADPAFRLRRNDLGYRESVVFALIFAVLLSATAVPLIAGIWPRWVHSVFAACIVLVLFSLSFVLTFRVARYLAARLEGWLSSKNRTS